MTTDGLLFRAELTARNQWYLWGLEPDRKGRPTKVPYRPDGRKAASDNPSTWSTFQKVCDVLGNSRGAMTAWVFSSRRTTQFVVSIWIPAWMETAIPGLGDRYY